ncbi:primosomal replication protein N [Paenalcaligenes suwonensis]|uniref:primosomal replication protein N n=1 Tax=Paenalcaligenes suwonensis TaxID=1202713 RepID=UPI0014072D94|nr:primosomal replication protein N [Paenalcaligenes suwonensis]NHC61980.1 primosomal replication protein N [Paenalcaligenes suwonensis]
MNHLTFTAVVATPGELRYTPAGLPAIELTLQHQSEVIEAGLKRRLDFQVDAVALGDTALLLVDVPLGATVDITGFIAPLRKASVRMIVHIQEVRVRYPGSATVVV